MFKRLILGVLSILSIFFLPWWVVLVFCLALLFYFKRFYEIILIALIADILYGTIHVTGFPYLITLTAIVLLFGVDQLKKNLSVY